MDNGIGLLMAILGQRMHDPQNRQLANQEHNVFSNFMMQQAPGYKLAMPVAAGGYQAAKGLGLMSPQATPPGWDQLLAALLPLFGQQGLLPDPPGLENALRK